MNATPPGRGEIAHFIITKVALPEVFFWGAAMQIIQILKESVIFKLTTRLALPL
jgi:uncharacterized membrane protein YjfL (UPF0719 family)